MSISPSQKTYCHSNDQTKQIRQSTDHKQAQPTEPTQSTQPSSIIGCSLLNTCAFNFIAKSLDSLKLLVPFIALEGVRLMISCHHHVARSIGITAFSWQKIVGSGVKKVPKLFCEPWTHFPGCMYQATKCGTIQAFYPHAHPTPENLNLFSMRGWHAHHQPLDDRLYNLRWFWLKERREIHWGACPGHLSSSWDGVFPLSLLEYSQSSVGLIPWYAIYKDGLHLLQAIGISASVIGRPHCTPPHFIEEDMRRP